MSSGLEITTAGRGHASGWSTRKEAEGRHVWSAFCGGRSEQGVESSKARASARARQAALRMVREAGR